MRRAVIDVGSNSVLLTVAEERDGQWVPILETTHVTALGEGVKATGLLQESRIAATLDAISEGFEHARDLGVQNVSAWATMAARIATNATTFQARAEAQGTPVGILSGDDEAELGFLAVANDPTFSRFSKISIVDVGGHSTEIVSDDNPSPRISVSRGGVGESPNRGWGKFRKSFPIGTLALLSGTFKAEMPDTMARFRAAAEIDEVLQVSAMEGGVVIALGATGTNLVSIRDKMATWEPDKVHGAYLDYEEVGRAVAWLSSMSLEDRAQIVGMEKGREKTLPGGALILERALYALKAEGCYVSVRGWRHALLEGVPLSLVRERGTRISERPGSKKTTVPSVNGS